jgi:hypothetical protein
MSVLFFCAVTRRLRGNNTSRGLCVIHFGRRQISSMKPLSKPNPK